MYTYTCVIFRFMPTIIQVYTYRYTYRFNNYFFCHYLPKDTHMILWFWRQHTWCMFFVTFITSSKSQVNPMVRYSANCLGIVNDCILTITLYSYLWCKYSTIEPVSLFWLILFVNMLCIKKSLESGIFLYMYVLLFCECIANFPNLVHTYFDLCSSPQEIVCTCTHWTAHFLMFMY